MTMRTTWKRLGEWTVMSNVNGCAVCGHLERDHGCVADTNGIHYYVPPSDSLRKTRMSDPTAKV